MSNKKERFDVIASSLSSYFGVGFLTPQEQLEVDLGNVAREFDEESLIRMELGNEMENATLDYFEKRMGIKIDERNSEIAYAVNGLLKCKRDGRTFIDGIETGVESKYSNAYSNFVDNLGYHIQCQAYMMAFGLEQWALLGMWQGSPQFMLLKADPELQKDIEAIVLAVSGILHGLDTFDNYPWHIVAKYQKEVAEELTELDEDDFSIFYRAGVIKQEMATLKKEYDEIEKYIKKKFKDFRYENDAFKYSLTTSAGRRTFDKNLFSIENPTFDLNKYMTLGASYSGLRITPKKKRGEND